MKYVIGIDSGGTKYLIKAFNLEGKELAEYTGPSAAHYRFPKDVVVERINAAIDSCLAKFKGKRKECAYFVCGTTGIDSEEDKTTVEQIYRSLSGFTCPIDCINDAEVAHQAVTGGIGVVLIAGTGSIAFGRNSQGKTARAGAWPMCIFGDEGSGTWISYKALRHLGQWLDGNTPSSILTDLLVDTLKITKKEDLIQICIQIEHFEWNNPGLSALVNKAGEKGDPYAIQILKNAAEETFSLADTVVGRLKFQEEPTFKVGVWGSAITKSPLHFRYFKEQFETKYSNVKVLNTDIDAAIGGCRIALARLKKTE